MRPTWGGGQAGRRGVIYKQLRIGVGFYQSFQNVGGKNQKKREGEAGGKAKVKGKKRRGSNSLLPFSILPLSSLLRLLPLPLTKSKEREDEGEGEGREGEVFLPFSTIPPVFSSSFPSPSPFLSASIILIFFIENHNVHFKTPYSSM